MTLERWVRVIAGAFVTVSVVLSHLHSSYWLLFTLFVGLNLFQSGWTGFCPLEMALRQAGVGRGSDRGVRPSA